jgi:hypothetical protein
MGFCKGLENIDFNEGINIYEVEKNFLNELEEYHLRNNTEMCNSM